MRKVRIITFFLLLNAMIKSIAQVSISGRDTNFAIFNNKMLIIIDSIRNIQGDSVLKEEGSILSAYNRFYYYWKPRLGENLNYDNYYRSTDKAIQHYYPLNTLLSSNTNWIEIGPKSTPQGSGGIGPIEHIDIFRNNAAFLLCCNTPGSIFYSNNGGLNWQSTNADFLGVWGFHRAIFHPQNSVIWYATTGGGENEESFIGQRGGVYRTMDNGQSFQNIADYTVLGFWNIIHEIKADYTNGDVLYLATENGLYKCNNATSPSPSWTKVLSVSQNGKVYDVDIHPTNPQIIYASVLDLDIITNSMKWRIKISYDGGLTWQDITNFTPVSGIYQNIEVSKANPNKLYVLIYN